MANLYAERIAALRAIMARNGWDAVIVTATDPHSSEYPALRWKQVEWLSGFSGEYGDIVVTMDHAGLWTDTRYFIAANKVLPGTGIELHKLRVPEQVTIPEWLPTVFPAGAVIAVDGLCQSADAIAKLSSFEIVDVPDMLSQLWEDRPEIPQSPIETLGVEFAGESRLERFAWLRGFLQEKGCDAMLITDLAEIAWMLNVRGGDIAYNPLVMSYLLVSKDNVEWYVKKDSLKELDDETLDSFEELEKDGVKISGYSDLAVGLMAAQNTCEKIYVDPATLNYTVSKKLADIFGDDNIVMAVSPIRLRKGIKNATEIAGFREAYIEDGVAMTKFVYWLEKAVSGGGHVTEWDASVKLTSLRAEIPGYKGDSFENISAYGQGAALPHYVTPQDDTAPELKPWGFYLIDSGGQYLFGTTDTTRTVPLGPCTDLERLDYTLVLRGMIDFTMSVFPYGTAGCRLDSMARMPLWRAQRDFGHGTGHGTGFFLGVHEGPQDLRQNLYEQAILPGMVTTIEPGLYREGMHGVRHENTNLCVDLGENEFRHWCGFEELTCCHIDTAPILKHLMTFEEIEWLNKFNEKVYRTLAPKLPAEIAAWLREKTLPL